MVFLEKDIAGKEIVRASDLKFDKESIQNDWLDLAREVESGVHSGENYNLNCAALNGIRAPIPDQLEIKGSWLTGVDRCEYVTPSKKRSRLPNIHVWLLIVQVVQIGRQKCSGERRDLSRQPTLEKPTLAYVTVELN